MRPFVDRTAAIVPHSSPPRFSHLPAGDLRHWPVQVLCFRLPSRVGAKRCTFSFSLASAVTGPQISPPSFSQVHSGNAHLPAVEYMCRTVPSSPGANRWISLPEAIVVNGPRIPSPMGDHEFDRWSARRAGALLNAM